MFFDVAIEFEHAPPEVGHMVDFAMRAIGCDNIRPTKIVLHAGLPGSRLWRSETPLSVVWQYLPVACLGSEVEVEAFSSLHHPERKTQLNAGEYFGIASISSLPEWVHLD